MSDISSDLMAHHPNTLFRPTFLHGAIRFDSEIPSPQSSSPRKRGRDVNVGGLLLLEGVDQRGV